MPAIIRVAIGSHYQQQAEITRPSVEAYAKRIGADLVTITERKHSKLYPMFEKMALGEYLQKYSRVLVLDSDIIVRSDCPNLFEIVPEGTLGLYDEGKLATPEERESHRETVELAYRQYLRAERDLWPWDGHFYNTGVIVASCMSERLFRLPAEEHCGNYWDQSWFNVILREEKVQPFDIGYKFNRMNYLEGRVESRWESWIIHYAGMQHRPDINELIAKDLAVWKAAEGNPWVRRS